MFFGENLDKDETEVVRGEELDDPQLLEPTIYDDVDNSDRYEESIVEDADEFGVDLDEVEMKSREDIDNYYKDIEHEESAENKEADSPEARLDEIRRQKEALLDLREELLAEKDIDIDIDDTDGDDDQPYVRRRTR